MIVHLVYNTPDTKTRVRLRGECIMKTETVLLHPMMRRSKSHLEKPQRECLPARRLLAGWA